jgi:MFS family permease
VLFIGGFITLLAFFGSSFVTSPSLFIGLYCTAFGFGKGLMYSAALAAGWSHLPKRKGLASGVIICGFGFGGFIFGKVTTSLCNPNNVNPQLYSINHGQSEHFFPPEVADRVPKTLQKLCLIYTCLWLFGLLTVTNFYQRKPPV